METKPTREFVALLADVYGSYGKPIPDAAVIGPWWRALAPFTHATVAQAFSAYALERPDFAPVPNSIAARCRLLDGRPTDDEAWASALTSLDERVTVVWTVEMAEAFRLCRPVLDSGDEVGARMAFRDAYNRLVSVARAEGRPVAWNVSQGWDGNIRAVAVGNAVRAGLLEGRKVAAIEFPGKSDTEPYPEGLKRVKELVATLEDPRIKAQRIQDARMEAEFEADQAVKRDIDQRVKQYQIDHQAETARLYRVGKAKLEP